VGTAGGTAGGTEWVLQGVLQASCAQYAQSSCPSVGAYRAASCTLGTPPPAAQPQQPLTGLGRLVAEIQSAHSERLCGCAFARDSRSTLPWGACCAVLQCCVQCCDCGRRCRARARSPERNMRLHCNQKDATTNRTPSRRQPSHSGMMGRALGLFSGSSPMWYPFCA
jgi:hypothetical protein